MDDHPAGPHPSGHQAGPGDVADGLFQRLGTWIGQIDKVRGVKGQDDVVLLGRLTYLSGRFLPHMDPFAALVLIAVQPQLPKPLGGVR